MTFTWPSNVTQLSTDISSLTSLEDPMPVLESAFAAITRKRNEDERKMAEGIAWGKRALVEGFPTVENAFGRSLDMSGVSSGILAYILKEVPGLKEAYDAFTKELNDELKTARQEVLDERILKEQALQAKKSASWDKLTRFAVPEKELDRFDTMPASELAALLIQAIVDKHDWRQVNTEREDSIETYSRTIFDMLKVEIPGCYCRPVATDFLEEAVAVDTEYGDCPTLYFVKD